MWTLWHLFLCALLCTSALEVVQGQEARAVFNAKGIKGYVLFSTVAEGIRVQANLQGLEGDHQWHVHLYPIDQTVDPNVQCTGDYVGPHYDPFNRNNDSMHGHETGGAGGAGQMDSHGGKTAYEIRCANDRELCEAGDLVGKFGFLSPGLIVVDNTSSLFLRGQYSIIGRSLIIHSTDQPFPNFECANILSMAELNGTSVTVLQSTFVYPIAGVMYFRQVQGEEVQMWGKMFWVNGETNTEDHNWHIHRYAPGEEFRLGKCNTSGNIGGHFAPFGNGPPSIANYSIICNPGLLTGCEVGDLSNKHGTINVPASPVPYSNDAFFFTDSFLNLTGVNAVEGRSIAIHRANRGAPVVACAPLFKSETITLTQYGEKEVTISQTSPYEDTIITNSRPREMTVIQNSALAPLVLDCRASSDLIFNEYAPPPQENSGTPDRFSTGALHSRYPEVNRVTGPQRVFDLPVYGANSSINSLNLRTARNNQNNCSSLIVSLMDDNVIIAKASFSGSLRGAVYFIQRDYGDGQAGSDMLGNTFIIVDMYKAIQAASGGHGWRVSPGATPTGCPNSPSVFNPYSINISTSGCTPQAQLGCASGDLSGKHGTIGIGSDTTSRPTYTFTDNNVLLTGSFSVIGNSVAILDSNSNSGIDCGTITRTYISATSFTFIGPKDPNAVRSTVINILASEINVDPSDILVLNMLITEKSFGLKCTSITVRVLGSSQSTADSAATMLKAKEDNIISQIKCGAMRSAAVSMLAMAVPLMLALFHLVFKN